MENISKYNVGDKVFMIDRSNSYPEIKIKPIYKIIKKDDGFYYGFEYYERHPVKEADLCIDKEELMKKYLKELNEKLKRDVDYEIKTIERYKKNASECRGKSKTILETKLKDKSSGYDFSNCFEIGQKVYSFGEGEHIIHENTSAEKKIPIYSAATFTVSKISIEKEHTGIAYHPKKGYARYGKYVHGSKEKVDKLIANFCEKNYGIIDLDVNEEQ
jgi:hypothetical protein